MGPIYSMREQNFPPVAGVPAVVMATVTGGTPVCTVNEPGNRPIRANKQFTISCLIKDKKTTNKVKMKAGGPSHPACSVVLLLFLITRHPGSSCVAEKHNQRVILDIMRHQRTRAGEYFMDN